MKDDFYIRTEGLHDDVGNRNVLRKDGIDHHKLGNLSSRKNFIDGKIFSVYNPSPSVCQGYPKCLVLSDKTSITHAIVSIIACLNSNVYKKIYG